MSIGSLSGSTVTSNGTTSSTSSSTGSYNLSTQDFITMMVTQLQNQDPLNPTSSQDLLQQESSIGSLEASTDTQTAMQNISLQTQIGSASSLIGKSVTGIGSDNNNVSGTVTSVSVTSTGANLNLTDGSTLSLTNVSSIQDPDDDGSTGGTSTN
jgi:flagellar basal-body rod modification protein FlgD